MQMNISHHVKTEPEQCHCHIYITSTSIAKTPTLTWQYDMSFTLSCSRQAHASVLILRTTSTAFFPSRHPFTSRICACFSVSRYSYKLLFAYTNTYSYFGIAVTAYQDLFHDLSFLRTYQQATSLLHFFIILLILAAYSVPLTFLQFLQSLYFAFLLPL